MKRKLAILLLVAAALMLAGGLFAEGPRHFDKEMFKLMLSKDTSPVIAVFAMLIPITAISGMTVFSVFFVKWWHQRRMLMIEKGQVDQSLAKYRLHSLLWGIIGTAIGLGVTAQQLFTGKTLRGGLVMLSIGLALLLFRAIISRKDA